MRRERGSATFRCPFPKWGADRGHCSGAFRADAGWPVEGPKDYISFNLLISRPSPIYNAGSQMSNKRKIMDLTTCKCKLMSFSRGRITPMRITSALSSLTLRRVLFSGVFIASAAMATAWNAGMCRVQSGSSPRIAQLEVTVLPKVGPTWQRPSPATWSSRFNVRWEARFSSESRYMV